MSGYIKIAAVLFVLCVCSCKKDLLHWRKINQLTSGTTARLSKAQFINDSICIVAGGEKWARSEILRSADGGYTWSSISNGAEKGMYDIARRQDGSIYLCGIDGIVLRSGDRGASWQFNRIGDWSFYTSVSFPSTDTAIFINSIALDTGYITQTDANFNVIDRRKFSFALNKIYTPSPSTAYVVGYGVVMKSTDFRRTWQHQDAKRDDFTCMDIHGDEIWMCGYNGSISHTVNGGNSWERLRNGNDLTLPQYRLYSIVFKNNTTGWAAGERGKLIRTDDGGKHWAEYDPFTNNTVRDLTICPNGDILAIGDNGIIFRISPQ